MKAVILLLKCINNIHDVLKLRVSMEPILIMLRKMKNDQE